MNIEKKYELAEKRNQLLGNSLLPLGGATPHWIDEKSFWYVHRADGAMNYRLVDAALAMVKPLFDHDRLAGALRESTGHDTDIIRPTELRLLGLRVRPAGGQLSFRAFGKPWLYCDATGVLEEDKKAAPPNYVPSPDGTLYVFRRDNNLWIQEVHSGDQHALTSDGEASFSYGVGPSARWQRPVAGSVEAAPLQVVWSDDSKRLLTVRFDERKVRDSLCLDYVPTDGSQHEVLYSGKFARPGDQHVPEATVYAFNVAARTCVAARYNTVPAVRMLDAIADVGLLWWGDDEELAYFVDVERGEQHAHVVEFNTKTGGCKRVFSEVTDTYLELGPNVYVRSSVTAVKGAREVVWQSERSGEPQLYLYDLASGTCTRQITTDEWRVAEVIHVDATRREVLFTASAYNAEATALHRTVCSVSLDGGAVRIITPEVGDHQVLNRSEMGLLMAPMFGEQVDDVSGISPKGDYFVESVATVSGPMTSYLRTRAGDLILTLAKTDVSALGETWNWPEPFRALAADGATPIFGIMFKPSDFDPAKKYPLIDFIYGGPQVMHTPRGLMRLEEMLGTSPAAALAELGFVVTMIDGRGTTGRSRKFHEHSHGAVQKASDIDDHVSAIEELAKRHDFIDIARVGITGFSAGGFATAGAMLRRPDFFKVGVAGSGNYDQRTFWHTWGERYHGKADYNDQSLVRLAGNLQGKLMFTHGLLDVGCGVGALFQLVQALQEANKDVDVVLEAQLQHELGGYGLRRTWDYFVEHLGGMSPPVARSIKTGVEILKEQAAAWAKPKEVAA